GTGTLFLLPQNWGRGRGGGVFQLVLPTIRLGGQAIECGTLGEWIAIHVVAEGEAIVYGGSDGRAQRWQRAWDGADGARGERGAEDPALSGGGAHCARPDSALPRPPDERDDLVPDDEPGTRSEERRVGKECGGVWGRGAEE